MQTQRNGKSPRNKTANPTTSTATLNSEYNSLRKTIISNMKRGSFTADDLLGPARRMQELLPQVFRSQKSQEAAAELLKMRAYISEIYYFFDLKRDALQVLEDGHVGRLGLELFNGGKIKRTDCFLTREKIRAYLAYIQASLYGREQYPQAVAEFEKCVLLIKSKLMHDNNFQSNSTLALCYYNQGRALRQCSRHDEAMRAFSDALFYFHLRYQNRLKNYEQREAALLRLKRRPNSELELLRELKRDETMMFHHRAGLVFGRGMAWSNYAKGQLLTALTENIVPARVFLDETKDEISKGYLNLIESTILRNLSERSRAETRTENLKQAKQLLTKSIASFQAHRHTTYESRALYELSIVLLYMRQFDAALDEINKVIKRVEGKSPRWHANSLVYRARILSYACQHEKARSIEDRKQQLISAFKDAQDAKDEASDQHSCMIDSLIVQADSSLQLLELTRSAPADSKEWLEKSDKALSRLSELNFKVRNPRVDAYRYLYQTLRYWEIGDLDEAVKCYSRWLAIQPRVAEDWAITELGRLVERKAAAMRERSFVVTVLSSSDPWANKAQFDFWRLRQDLLAYLEQQAKRHGVTRLPELLNLLNINKSLYHSTKSGKRRVRKRKTQSRS